MEKFKIPKWVTMERVIVALIVIFALVMCIKFNNKAEKEAKEKISLLKQYESTSQEFEAVKKVLKGKNTLIASQDQIILTKSEALEAELITNKELKAINVKLLQSKTAVEEEFIAYKLEAEFKDPVIIHDTVDVNLDNYLKLPQEFGFKDPFISFKGIITTKGVTMQEIALKNEFAIYIGEDRKGFKGMFQKRKPTVRYVSENPYSQVNKMSNLVIEKRKWYDSTLFKIGIGFIGGVLIMR